MEQSGRLEANKAVVRKFLESMPSRDLAAIGECLAEDVVQHYHFLYRCLDGKVVEYWEYVDTRYAQATLFT